MTMYKELNNRCLGRKPVTKKFQPRNYLPIEQPEEPSFNLGFALVVSIGIALAFMAGITVL